MEQTVPVTKFSDLNITTDDRSITGQKVGIEEVLGKEILIHSYIIEDTKIERFKQSGSLDCLYLQFTMDKRECLLFTRGKNLIKAMREATAKNARFPISTTIVKDQQRRLLFK